AGSRRRGRPAAHPAPPACHRTSPRRGPARTRPGAPGRQGGRSPPARRAGRRSRGPEARGYDTHALKRLLRGLAMLAPLALVAAGPVQNVPDRTPGENDLQRPLVVGVYDWLTILPAPHTPEGFQPGPGPREQWPLRGPITQPFGCTEFELERP